MKLRETLIAHGFIDTLTKEEVDLVEGYVETFSDYWVPRGTYCSEGGFQHKLDRPLDFYTIGAVTYIDGLSNLEGYYKYAEQVNPTLYEYFGWLYKIVLDKLSEVIGPCELIGNLGHPGFHVFGHKPGEYVNQYSLMAFTQPLATIHHDLQQEKHKLVWEYYKDYDLDYCLTFTLPIVVPESGAGLNTWDDIRMCKYDKDDAYSKEIKRLDYGKYGPPLAVVPYTPGKMFYFIGKLLHQIAPVSQHVKSTDRRITLQGHGVMCDGVWRIYF